MRKKSYEKQANRVSVAVLSSFDRYFCFAYRQTSRIPIPGQVTLSISPSNEQTYQHTNFLSKETDTNVTMTKREADSRPFKFLDRKSVV